MITWIIPPAALTKKWGGGHPLDRHPWLKYSPKKKGLTVKVCNVDSHKVLNTEASPFAVCCIVVEPNLCHFDSIQVNSKVLEPEIWIIISAKVKLDRLQMKQQHCQF